MFDTEESIAPYHYDGNAFSAMAQDFTLILMILGLMDWDPLMDYDTTVHVARHIYRHVAGHYWDEYTNQDI